MTVAITLRSVKGTALTSAEVDANFTNLNTGKLDVANTGNVNGANPANLLVNSTGEFGTAGWAVNASPNNFSPVGSVSDSNGSGFQNLSALTTATFSQDSSPIPFAPNAAVALQADMSSSGLSAGSFYVSIRARDSGGGDLGQVCIVSASVAAGYSVRTATGTTPSGTASIVVRRGTTAATIAANGANIRRIKAEVGAVSTMYSQEASMLAFSTSPPVNISPVFQAVQALGKITAVNSPNLLFNGSGELGNNGWATTNFGATTDANGAPVFTNAASITTGASVTDTGTAIPVVAGTNVTVSGEINTSGMSGGNAQFMLNWYDSGGSFLSQTGLTTPVPFGSGWTYVSKTAVAPASTASVQITKGGFSNPLASAGGIQFRRIKTEIGITPSLYSDEANTPVLAGFGDLGQCRFNFVSSTQCSLVRFNGKYLTINGSPQVIPGAGVTLANTGLTAGSTYYVYAYMNSGTMTLEASVTGHSQDVNTGVEIKTGDATRTLVGMVFMAAGTPGLFQQGSTQLGVLSYFNRRRVNIKYATGAGTISGTTFGQNGNQSGVLNWAFEPVVARLEDANCSPNTSSQVGYAGISVDSTTTPFTTTFYHAWTANAQGELSATGTANNTEGIHIYRMLSRVSAGTATFGANVSIETMG